MRKTAFFLLLLVLLLAVLFLTVFAHPGRTDSAGGHTDSSTGEYHYHHGYPAHSHIGGCPYNYNDKTGGISGSAGTAQQDINSDDSGGAGVWIIVLLAAAGASLYVFFKCDNVLWKNILFFLTDFFILISGIIGVLNDIVFFGIVLIVGGFVSIAFHFKWLYFDS